MLRNLTLTLFSKASVAVMNFLILLLISRQLGSGVLGQTSLLIVNIAIAQIVNEIYTGYALVHYIPRISLKKLYSNGLLWTLLCIGSVNLVFIIFHIGAIEFRMHALILSFTISLHSFHCVILLAREKFKSYNFLLFFQPLLTLSTLCVCVFVLDIRNITSYITGVYVSFITSVVISSLLVIRVIAADRMSQKISNNVSILKNGFINQLGNLAHTLSNRYNFYLIGSSALVGVYSSATSLIESVWIIGGSIAPVVLSHVANKKDSDNQGQLTFLLSKLSLMLSACCVLIIYILPTGFFTWLLGNDFTQTKSLMLHLSPGILCISFSTVISHYFSGQGNQRVQLLANSIGLFITICSSYYLVSQYGLVGACYAASLSYFVASLVLVIVFMKQNRFHFSSLFKLREDFSLLRKNT